MQIFVFHEAPHLAAQMHCDAHCHSQIKEAAQMLSTAVRVTQGISNDIEIEDLYKSFVPNHQCCRWVRESLGNAEWLYQLAQNLDAERKYRFGSETPHQSLVVCEKAIKILRRVLPKRGITPFALPLGYEEYPAIGSFRRYFLEKKQHLAKWTKRGAPFWYTGGEDSV